MSTSTPQPRARRTQEERSAETRERLLDATIESLIDAGYARTTTTAVCERAGLSRGAQLHHFPTKSDLVICAVTHLAAKRGDEIRAQRERLADGNETLGTALDLVWASFSGPLFHAALELWVAARTDPELHANLYSVERRVGRNMAQLFREFAGQRPEGEHQIEDVLELTFYVMRGMALQRILRDDDTERLRLFELWKHMVSTVLHEPISLNTKQRSNS
ncbi:MAG: TetR family transcriptional regulator [bacterium]|nr:TetR family transcriptional regulator [bacterium]